LHSCAPDKIFSIGPIEAYFEMVDGEVLPFLDVQEADARLIAAAPEMYEALKDAKQALRYFSEMNTDRLKPPALWHIEKINEVLNKIEGANE
jgi:hypothetical protein